MNEVNGKEAEVEKLKKDEDVRRALEQTQGEKPKTLPVVESKQKFFLGTYFVLFVAFAALYYLVNLGYFAFANPFEPIVLRVVIGAMAVILVAAIGSVI